MSVLPVLLPGHMCDARLWRGGASAIAGAFATSSIAAPCDADLSHDASIAEMATRTLANATGCLLPVGFSMGAIVAVEMWVQAPHRISGLVLLGYNATADLPERAELRPLQQARVLQGELERVLVDELKPNYLAGQHRGNAALLALLREMGMALGPEVFIRQSEALRLRADRRDVLRGITVPVLTGCGEEDRLCPPAWHSDWAALIDGSELFIVPGAGHMLPLEAPDVLAARLGQWLAAKDLA